MAKKVFMYSKDLTNSITIRISAEDLDYCNRRAIENDISISRYIRWLIKDDRLFHDAESDYLNPDSNGY